MRYLLLSVLVVCVIGIMIPSVSAYHVPENAGVMHSPVSGAPSGCNVNQHVTDIRTDKETYQSGETVNFTVEVSSSCREYNYEYFDLEFIIQGYKRSDCQTEDGYRGSGCYAVEMLHMREGDQKTFQFKPEILTWTQEYQVQERLSGGAHPLFSFYVLPTCGEGTVLVDGACQLASTGSDTGLPEDYDPLFYDVMLYYGKTAAEIIVVAIAVGGGIIVVIFAVWKRSKTPKPVKQKPVKKEETSAFCENCGNTLNPKAKFCGKCGTART